MSQRSARSQRGGGPRDTAKDILLGLTPSGEGPRAPREGRLLNNGSNGSARKAPPVAPVSPMPARQTPPSLASAANANDLNELRRLCAALEAAIIRLQQDVSHLKGAFDRHSSDLIQLNNDVKSRPAFDQNKATSAQILDGRVRDLHGQLMGIQQALNGEMTERKRIDQEQAFTLARLQSMVQDQDGRRNEILQHLAQQGNSSNAKMSEEARRLNDKISLITDEVTRNLLDKEARIRDENNQKYLALEKAIKAELEARLQYERDLRRMLEERFKVYSDGLNETKTVQQSERDRYKEKFRKLNEALAVLEGHMEHGNRKIDKVVSAEIQSRRLHERGLLAKLTEVEDRLAAYLSGLDRSMDDLRRGKQSKPPPPLDTDALRREMDAIAGDKHKLSMEGLLKLEEKLQRIQRALDRDSRDLRDKLDSTSQRELDPESLAKLRQHLQRLEQTQEDIERTHDAMKDKVERQIPQDLEELTAKLENAKRQLHERIDKEENERFLSVKELQDEISKLKNRPIRDTQTPVPVSAADNDGLVADVNECKIAIKKLVESVTTVKNVLDRKLNDEIRTREKETVKLEKAVDLWKGGANKRK